MQVILPLHPVYELQRGDVIYFGDGLCFVIAVEANDPYLDGSSVTLITEGEAGMQYIDYLTTNRRFTVVRTVN